MSPRIGIIGGTGVYDPKMFDVKKKVCLSTPYGAPSDAIQIGEMDGVEVAFLPRHGSGHTLPPHKVNYRANIWAFKRARGRASDIPLRRWLFERGVRTGRHGHRRSVHNLLKRGTTRSMTGPRRCIFPWPILSALNLHRYFPNTPGSSVSHFMRKEPISA